MAAVAFAGAQTGSAFVPTPVQMPSDAQSDVGNPTLSYTGRYVARRAKRADTGPLQRQVRRTDMNTGASELLNSAVGGGLAPGNHSLTNAISSNGAPRRVHDDGSAAGRWRRQRSQRRLRP